MLTAEKDYRPDVAKEDHSDIEDQEDHGDHDVTTVAFGGETGRVPGLRVLGGPGQTK